MSRSIGAPIARTGCGQQGVDVKPQLPRVFVMLPYGFDAVEWRRRYDAGQLSEMSPYGYHHARTEGFIVAFSADSPETTTSRYFRRVANRVLRFDLVHVWRNRRALLSADVVWTHTEREHLGVSLLYKLLRRRRDERPKLLAQSVWLADEWREYGGIRRRLVRLLLREADVLTVHAPAGQRLLQLVGGEALPVRLVPYGVNFAPFMSELPAVWKKSAGPIRILTIGNDVHRDWHVLTRAFADRGAFEIVVLSPRVLKLRNYFAGLKNFRVRFSPSIADLLAWYRWADVVVIPLQPNAHSSGLTVMLETAAVGKPMIVTRTGDLDTYLGDDAVRYIPAGDPEALACAVQDLVADPTRVLTMLHAARAVVLDGRFSSRNYVRQHCALSREMMEGMTPLESTENPFTDDRRAAQPMA